METQEKIVNRYVEKPVKTKNGFAMLALILLLFFGSIAAMVCGRYSSRHQRGRRCGHRHCRALVLISICSSCPG